MENDDRPVGRILSRREVIRLMGLGGLSAFLAACGGQPAAQGTPQSSPGVTGQQVPPQTAVPTGLVSTLAVAIPQTGAQAGCVVKPEMTEGPYFIDEKLNRVDIRGNASGQSVQEGVVLALTFNVSSAAQNACQPLAGAQVDIWHCNALGVYSNVAGGAGNPGTLGQQFLRGYQVTDASGVARFITIYPGWYRGRAVHIHFKIRAQTSAGQAYEFTSQLFFDDALSDKVFQQQPYVTTGTRDTRNANDGIYQNGGSLLTLAPVAAQDGYAAAFAIALDLSDTRAGQPDAAGAEGPAVSPPTSGGPNPRPRLTP